MKIHVVQKGDTLWNLSKKYNVNFEELKAVNSQLANPDLIMPGMKIKIPNDKKQVTNQGGSSQAKEKLMTPFKQVPQKAQPVIKEDDHKPKQKVQKKSPLPKLPPVSIQMPKLPSIHANQYNIDVDIDDNDTIIQNKSYYNHQHHHMPEMKPEIQKPVEHVQPQLPKVEPLPAQVSPYNQMMMPCMPYPMMYCPQQSCHQMPVQNMCQSCQNQSLLYANQAYQQAQMMAPLQQTYPYSAQWGELDVNDMSDEELDNVTENTNVNQPMTNPYQNAMQCPAQNCGCNQQYSYNYPYYYGMQNYGASQQAMPYSQNREFTNDDNSDE